MAQPQTVSGRTLSGRGNATILGRKSARQWSRSTGSSRRLQVKGARAVTRDSGPNTSKKLTQPGVRRQYEKVSLTPWARLLPVKGIEAPASTYTASRLAPYQICYAILALSWFYMHSDVLNPILASEMQFSKKISMRRPVEVLKIVNFFEKNIFDYFIFIFLGVYALREVKFVSHSPPKY